MSQNRPSKPSPFEQDEMETDLAPINPPMQIDQPMKIDDEIIQRTIDEVDQTLDQYRSPIKNSCQDESEVKSTETLNDECGDDEASAIGVVETRFDSLFRYKTSNHKSDHRVTSGLTMVRCLPWRILVIFHPYEPQGSIGVFVQCNADSTSQTWSCSATATICLINHLPNGKSKEMKIQHTFTQKENDWGFHSFLSYEELFKPENGFVTSEDGIEFFAIKARIKAEAPHGADWDSKRHTGFVGIRNQGATCYLNSLLQTLYCTNKLRRAVFLMPTESDDSQTSVALALQRVFYELQTADHAVGTKKLTRSFGWVTLDSVLQHDAQELCRVLLDNLENKMKGTAVEDCIPNLFCGKMLTYIKCLNVPYESKQEENFYDIQLKIKGNRTVDDAFKEYIKAETLQHNNKYDAGEYGLQDADKGIIFTKFPPVLYLHLMRFQYDFVADSNVKINDRFEFPYQLNLDPYLAEADPAKPANYFLHAVLVHSGDNSGGHYVVYLNPAGNGIWYQFDDDVVSRCSMHDAVTMNFGGTDDPEIRPYTNAYMLVYIAESARLDVLCPVSLFDIPETLRERFSIEQKLAVAKRIEKERGHLYTGIYLLLEEDFYTWQGPELCNHKTLPNRMIRVLKQATRDQLIEAIASVLNYPPEATSVWHFRPQRKNQIAILTELTENPLQFVPKDIHTFYVNCPINGPSDPVKPSSPLLTDQQQVEPKRHQLFLKFFDPTRWSMTFCGQLELAIDQPLSSLEPIMRQRANLDSSARLVMFHDDAKSGHVVELQSVNLPLSCLFKREFQGQVIYFQVKTPTLTSPSSLTTSDGTTLYDGLPPGSPQLDKSPGLVAAVNGVERPGANSNSSLLLDPTITDNIPMATGGINVTRLQQMALIPNTTVPASADKQDSLFSLPRSPLCYVPNADAMSIQNFCASHIYQVEVLLVDKSRPTDPGILLLVSEDLTYWGFAEVAAAYLSTQSNRLRFFRSQSASDSGTFVGGGPVSTAPSATDGTSPLGSDSGADSGTATVGTDNSSSADLLHLTPQEMAARASGFTGYSPYTLGLISSATSQGLAQEPPGAAIPSTHLGSMRDFLVPLRVTLSANNYSYDNNVGGGALGGTAYPAFQQPAAAQSDKLPAPYNRYSGVKTVHKCLFGHIYIEAPRRVYYNHLAIQIDELETMRQVRVFFVNSKLTCKTELLVSVPQNGLVSDLLGEASQHITLQPGGSGKLRLFEVFSNRILQEYSPSLKLSLIPDSIAFPSASNMPLSSHSLRVEEIPLDEVNLRPEETIVFVSHFDDIVDRPFGIPFSLKIQEGESYISIRSRIRKRLDVSEKEFERWRFAIVANSGASFIPDNSDSTVRIKQFQSCISGIRPWLGISHKPSKRPRCAHIERPIKIHN